MSRLRVAVVGVGHLGSIHARLLNSLDDVDLVGVVDPIPEARERVAQECHTHAFADVQSLSGQLDAAVIATPTHSHFEIARQLLGDGVSLLMEKPITANVDEADRLIQLAQSQQCVLQVGHVERFNPAWNATLSQLDNPRYIEAVRAGPYSFRSTDVSIVLDLMIHDLDLVLSLVNSRVVAVEALGAAVFGPHEDLAHARIRFENGCIVNLSASRVSYAPQRTMQLFCRQCFASIDFATGQAEIVRPSRDVLEHRVQLQNTPPEQRQQIQDTMFRDLLQRETLTTERVNAILEEQREFVAAIRQGQAIRVPGQQGRDALALADQILHSIRQHRWNGDLPGPVGPHFRPEPTVLHPHRAA
jgi:predicted dehydrogenase